MKYKAYFEDEESACNFADYIAADGWTVYNGNYDSIKHMHVVEYAKF